MDNFREEIMGALERYSKGIEEEDLPRLEEEWTAGLLALLGAERAPAFVSMIDQPTEAAGPGVIDTTGKRIVVIGDIHCDYAALRGIFYKLSVSSEYDYFNEAIFLFLGDYVDRGRLPLETLSFLFWFKRRMGDRCILLRGNHDDFRFDEEAGKFVPPVTPCETIELFSQYLHTELILRIGQFFDRLPYFAVFERGDRRFLLVHGGIPRDDYVDAFSLEQLSTINLPLAHEDPAADLLYSMLWGDPVETPFKHQDKATRFEFGSDQFDRFMSRTGFSYLIRSHEPVRYGFQEMYGNRLLTLHSTGGHQNEDSGYMDTVPFPAFAVMMEDGEVAIENTFLYRTARTGGLGGLMFAPRRQPSIVWADSPPSPFGALLPMETPSAVPANPYDIQWGLEKLPLNEEFFLKDRIPDFLPGAVRAAIQQVMGKNTVSEKTEPIEISLSSPTG